MTLRDVVRARYPEAEALHRAAPKGEWTIHAATGKGQPVVGAGATEAEAWSSAAETVQQVPKEENLERYLVPAIFRPWAVDLVDRVPPARGDRVLDVACGTGVVARLAAERVGAGGNVIGLDYMRAPLLVAGSIPTAVPIEWPRGDATDLQGLADAAFDVVFCQQGFQDFPDQPAALRAMHRVLRPGGRVALSAWRSTARCPGYDAVYSAVERIDPQVAARMREGCGEEDPSPLRLLIEEAGFTQVRVEPVAMVLRFPSAEEWATQWMACSLFMARKVPEGDPRRSELITSVKNSLEELEDAEGLRFPIEANIAVARKPE
jgi:ubiquinone/menaquinone biosynthesis C-methylase UbiE